MEETIVFVSELAREGVASFVVSSLANEVVGLDRTDALSSVP